MDKEEIIKAIKMSAFDAIVKAYKASDPYYKRMEVISEILVDATRLIREARENG